MAKTDRDPTEQTVHMLQREVEQQRVILLGEIEGLRREITTRLEGMDKALGRVEEYPTDVDLAVSRVREFYDEKFRSVELRFEERDRRFDLRDESSKELLAEQRTSAKEAIAKAEASVAQQLNSLNGLIGDVKERIDKTEGRAEGAVKLWGLLVAGVMLIIGVAGVAIAVMANG